MNGISFMHYTGLVVGGATSSITFGVMSLISFRISQMAHKKLVTLLENKMKHVPAISVLEPLLKVTDKDRLINLVAGVVIAAMAVLLGGYCMSFAASCIVPVRLIGVSLGLGIYLGGPFGAFTKAFDRCSEIDRRHAS